MINWTVKLRQFNLLNLLLRKAILYVKVNFQWYADNMKMNKTSWTYGNTCSCESCSSSGSAGTVSFSAADSLSFSVSFSSSVSSFSSSTTSSDPGLSLSLLLNTYSTNFRKKKNNNNNNKDNLSVGSKKLTTKNKLTGKNNEAKKNSNAPQLTSKLRRVLHKLTSHWIIPKGDIQLT